MDPLYSANWITFRWEDVIKKVTIIPSKTIFSTLYRSLFTFLNYCDTPEGRIFNCMERRVILGGSPNSNKRCTSIFMVFFKILIASKMTLSYFLLKPRSNLHKRQSSSNWIIKFKQQNVTREIWAIKSQRQK